MQEGILIVLTMMHHDDFRQSFFAMCKILKHETSTFTQGVKNKKKNKEKSCGEKHLRGSDCYL